MLTRTLSLLLASTIVLLAGGCGSTPMSTRIMRSTAILEEFQSSDRPIPASTLENAAGVAILSEISAGVGIGGSGGEGILLRRLNSGWSQPIAVSVGSGTIGVQLGAKGREMVVIFNTDAGVMRAATQGTTMVASASGTAGDASGTTSAMSGAPPATEIFSRSQGLFGGAFVGGFNIQVDTAVNQETYGSQFSTLDLLEGRGTPQPGMMRIERLLDGR
ncbi:MAG: lipid-binding SYLF domain-containing protein [Phycisphaeraceae bacterium]|nr:lipid-binding SYLF domain-containing protein [Phycisphaeraceae bacterium]